MIVNRKGFDELFHQEIEHQKLLGCAVAVMQKGELLFEGYYGSYNKNSIYKMYSMSKPLTATAVFILQERGLLDLNNYVSDYLPGFDQMMILDENNQLHKAKNRITIQHLLNMTSGIGYPLDSSPSELELIKIEKNLYDRALQGEKLSNKTICNEFAKAPLAFEPGTKWKYGANADILGGIVECISNVTFGEFLKLEIFDQLEMPDTGFYVPLEKSDRLAEMYYRNQDCTVESATEKMMSASMKFSFTLPQTNQRDTKKPIFESGGAGIYSTMGDYIHFMQMLIHNGEYKSKRILKRKTVEFMTSNQLKQNMRQEIYKDEVAGFCLQGYGYSNLLRIMEEPSQASSYGFIGEVGEYGWDGLPGNYFLIDPEKKLSMIYMQQITQGADFELRNKIRKEAYDMLP